MARSGPKGGRPRKWPPGTDLRQVHIKVPAELADAFKAAAEARGLTMVDWLIAVGSSAVPAPLPRPIQETMPINQAA